ncbi:MAG: tetratricopeptide repeat protein [Bacteroidota bacterium]|nr:tetratricopeptide repeat protein [Candidatus Kapabacteria bacterium]MDW8220416.1 tetratricopeptide repeat protein [Bacteroidota bacterium]
MSATVKVRISAFLSAKSNLIEDNAMITGFFHRLILLLLACAIGDATLSSTHSALLLQEAYAQTERAPSRFVPSRPTTRSFTTPRTILADAQRLLKLGNSYREARNYDIAQKYIQQGIEFAQKVGSRYWEATGYEYLGLVYRDIGDRAAALSALQRASDIFSSLIRQPDGSQRATQALIDDVQRNDRSRPPSSSALDTSASSTARSSQQYRSTLPVSRASVPSPSSLERERALNRQLTERIAALENKIRDLENRAVSAPTAGAVVQPLPYPSATESSPGIIARSMPRQAPGGGKPQAEFAPFQPDKKVRPEPAIRRMSSTTTAQATTTDYYTLPSFILQIGIGTGYNLHTVGLTNQRTVQGVVITENVYGNAPLLSFPLLSLSADFFLTPELSLGLLYGYYPGPDQSTTATTLVNSTTRLTTTSYHLLTLRPIYHIIRDRFLDLYAGIPLGTMVNLAPLFSPLSLYGGVLAGAQYALSRQVGVFCEISGGATYLGSTAFERATPTGDPRIGIGAYGRLGLSVSF